ncbi:hypothetical protein [Bifidobacterium callitrichidarum]|uniref:Uncharacterized protein n=1 Tax=Bifidobacterium callitrichidarum TaxID=2052941 RepID=A0A2U2NC00_9BIFI|nr:hypothetical protein [Bifidobacterium callitrichidarum]PWG66633.1 hypothetical protein DF196_01660 [Bifidobacterium callitrichidarum]
MPYDYIHPPKDSVTIGEWTKAWKNPETGVITISSLFDGLENSQIELLPDEADRLVEFIKTAAPSTREQSQRNRIALAAEAGTIAEQQRIANAEALHRAGRV